MFLSSDFRLSSNETFLWLLFPGSLEEPLATGLRLKTVTLSNAMGETQSKGEMQRAQDEVGL